MSHGGARPGAGRPRKATQGQSRLELATELLTVLRNRNVSISESLAIVELAKLALSHAAFVGAPSDAEHGPALRALIAKSG